MNLTGFTQPQHLNRWIEMFSDIYFPTQNRERRWNDMFVYLVEATAAFNKAVFRKDDREAAYSNLARMFAWFAGLCDVTGFTDLQGMTFRKFPLACPYCREAPCECRHRERQPIDWEAVRRLEENRTPPKGLRDWQLMFATVYPQAALGEYASAIGENRRAFARTHLRLVIAHLLEELGEVSEALRFRRILSNDVIGEEIADVFAWIIAAANCVGDALGDDRLVILEEQVWEKYPGACRTCSERPCQCWEPIVRGLVDVPPPAGANPVAN